jgi:hypothetical protein
MGPHFSSRHTREAQQSLIPYGVRGFWGDLFVTLQQARTHVGHLTGIRSRTRHRTATSTSFGTMGLGIENWRRLEAWAGLSVGRRMAKPSDSSRTMCCGKYLPPAPTFTRCYPVGSPTNVADIGIPVGSYSSSCQTARSMCALSGMGHSTNHRSSRSN